MRREGFHKGKKHCKTMPEMGRSYARPRKEQVMRVREKEKKAEYELPKFFRLKTENTRDEKTRWMGKLGAVGCCFEQK